MLAFALTTLSVSTQFGRDLLSTRTAMFDPLPAIALLPLALLWFRRGSGSLIFLLVHAVLWPLALYTDGVFAGLLLVIAIGLIVENVVFATFERLTVRRWGMVG